MARVRGQNGAPGKSFDFVQLRMVDWSTNAFKAYSYVIPGVQLINQVSYFSQRSVVPGFYLC